jgi:hypothetical protein
MNLNPKNSVVSVSLTERYYLEVSLRLLSRRVLARREHLDGLLLVAFCPEAGYSSTIQSVFLRTKFIAASKSQSEKDRESSLRRATF